MFTMLATAHAERVRRTLKDDNLQRTRKYSVLTSPRESLAEEIQEKKRSATSTNVHLSTKYQLAAQSNS